MEKNLEISWTASSKTQYKINNSIIFNYLKDNEPISRVEISRNLNVSPPAVSRVIDNLIKTGFVFESVKKVTKSGKRPMMLNIKHDKFYVVGIDLGKERLSFALTNLKSEVIKKVHGIRIKEDLDIKKVLIAELRQFIAKKDTSVRTRVDFEDIRGIGIGIPAAVDVTTGEITGVPHYKKWLGLNFKELITKEMKIPVFIDNDVNLSSLAEKNYGMGKNFKNLVFLEISNGVGAGIVIDNHLMRGYLGFAGEIGYMALDSKHFDEDNNEYEFLEKHSSLEEIKEKALSGIKNNISTSLKNILTNSKNGEFSAELICNAAIKGDIFSKAIINEMVNSLTLGISNLILILNPEIIVLGGDICTLPGKEELFLNPISSKVSKLIPIKIPEIIFSKLGEDAGIIGASHIAIESLLVKEFPYKKI